MGKTNQGSIWAAFSFWRGKQKKDIFSTSLLVSQGFTIFFPVYIGSLEVGNHDRKATTVIKAVPLLRVERRSYWSRCRREGGVKNMSSDQLTLIICCFFWGIRLPIYQKIIIAIIGNPYYQTSTMECNKGLNHCSYGNFRELTYVNIRCGPLTPPRIPETNEDSGWNPRS